MSASFQRPVTDRVWWLTSAYAQWSPDRLHGVEQLSLGGESSVRGFKEQYISGNNGGYLRNELSWSLFSLPYVGTVRAVAALDGGWLHSDSDDPYSSGTLWVLLPGSAPPVAMFPVRSLPDCLWFTRTGLPLTISRFTGALPSRFKGLLPCISLPFASLTAC